MPELRCACYRLRFVDRNQQYRADNNLFDTHEGARNFLFRINRFNSRLFFRGQAKDSHPTRNIAPSQSPFVQSHGTFDDHRNLGRGRLLVSQIRTLFCGAEAALSSSDFFINPDFDDVGTRSQDEVKMVGEAEKSEQIDTHCNRQSLRFVLDWIVAQKKATPADTIHNINRRLGPASEAVSPLPRRFRFLTPNKPSN